MLIRCAKANPVGRAANGRPTGRAGEALIAPADRRHDLDKVPEPKARKQRREAPRHERAIMQGKNEWPGR
jgi:hypothetical protein